MSNKFDYKNLTPFKWCVIQNFPFIEEDFDAITNYQLLCKVVEYLNKTITATNTLGTQVETLTNWFNNLDVQDEINTKLDQMAQDGTLAQIINQEIFSDINNKLDIINSNNTIMMGDSYGVGYTIIDGQVNYVNSWCYYLQNLLNLSDEQCYKFVEGGIGFADSGQGGHTNFLDLLKSNINTIENKTLIKNIIVCAGYNDKNADSIAVINLQINNFINYCKTNFPNAKVYIGMIGNDANKTSAGALARNTLTNNVLIAYQNCAQYGGIYLNGIENIMHYYPNFCSDGVHPTSDGYRILGFKIYQALKNGYSTYDLPYQNSTIDTTNISSFGDFRFGCQLCNNMVNFKITTGTLKFTDVVSLNTQGFIVLNEVDFQCYRYKNINDLCIPCFIGLTTSDNKYYGNTGYIGVNQNNELFVNVRLPKQDGTPFVTLDNIKSIFFGTGNITIPTINT